MVETTGGKVRAAVDAVASDTRERLIGRGGPRATSDDAAAPAASGGGDGAEAAGEQAVGLIRDLQDISFAQILGVLLSAWLAIVLVRRLLPYFAERGPSRMRLYLLGAVPILRLLILVVAVLWIVPLVLNITFENFLVVAGAAGVAIGFAFKDYVSSLIAGVVAVFEKPYRPGDWVRIGDDYGEVRSVGLRALSLQTPADDTVTVPHLRVWDGNIANSNDGARTLMCVADFYVHPDHDADRLRAMLRDVALTSGYLDYGRPVVVVLTEKPLGTHYKLKAYPFDMRDQFRFISDMTARGKRAIAAAGATPVVAREAVGASQ